MPDTPENSGPGSAANLVLPADNRGYSDHVVRIGGVAHPEKKTDGDDGEKTDHCVWKLRLRIAYLNHRGCFVKLHGRVTMDKPDYRHSRKMENQDRTSTRLWWR